MILTNTEFQHHKNKIEQIFADEGFHQALDYLNDNFNIKRTNPLNLEEYRKDISLNFDPNFHSKSSLLHGLLERYHVLFKIYEIKKLTVNGSIFLTENAKEINVNLVTPSKEDVCYVVDIQINKHGFVEVFYNKIERDIFGNTPFSLKEMFFYVIQ